LILSATPSRFCKRKNTAYVMVFLGTFGHFFGNFPVTLDRSRKKSTKGKRDLKVGVNRIGG
jgi:hypothetical protein